MIKLDNVRSKTLVTAGFVTMSVLLATFLLLWSIDVYKSKQLVDHLNKVQNESSQSLTAYFVVSERVRYLNKLRENHDWIVKQNAMLEFKKLSALLQPAEGSSNTSSLLAMVSAYSSSIQHFINQVSPLIEDHITNETLITLIEGEISRHKSLLMTIERLVDVNALLNSAANISNTLNDASQRYVSNLIIMSILGSLGLILALFTVYVVRSTGKTEDALMEQGKRIRELHNIISRPDLSLDEQIDETLRLGCRLLNMEIGKVGRQDPDKNESHFLNTIAPSDLPARRGIVLPLDKTFCNITFSSTGPIAISHVATSEFASHPAAAFLGMQAYIGTTIRVRGEKFGTVNFSNRKPRPIPFTETDKDFINLIGSWISVMMEKQRDAEELNKSKDDAEKANQAKSEFLANMSHEIRTPLTAILGFSDMLRDEDQTQEEINHEIDSIIRSGSHLQQIINDILDLSKIEAGQLVIETLEVDPIRMVLDMDSILGAKARDKGLLFEIKYEFPVPKNIKSDPTRLKQILFNLCGNAIKFTEKGGITVNVGYDKPSRSVSVAISDTGIGMSKEELNRLFTPFSQADSSTTRRFGGTGLGLVISRELANKLGGDISVTSEKSKGSTFTVTFGVGAVTNLEMITAAEQIDLNSQEELVRLEPNSLSGHVLLVEDSPDVQKLISKYLYKVGASVEIVDNGLFAMQKALTEDYDLIMMDIQMPIMDGLTATKKLRQQGYKKPIVSITANAMKEDKDKCFASGADEYLAKPLNLDRFFTVLRKYLKPNGDSKRSRSVA